MVEVNDVSETTVRIEETKLSDNRNNNAAIVAELVDHQNDAEYIDFEVEFEPWITSAHLLPDDFNPYRAFRNIRM